MRVLIIQPTVSNESKKKRVCAYARVSTDHDKQGESLENQVTYYRNLISTNPEYEFAGVFAERGITGTTENRPEFQRMLALCREGKIDIIITKSISRFARNTAIVLQTVRELKEIGVEVRFEKENLNTLSGDGELMLTVLSSFAQEESKNVSDNTKWQIRKKYEQGKVMVNTSRFLGYDKGKSGELVINKAEAKVVKRIYKEYLDGKGAFTIAKGLNQDKVPTVTAKQWHESTVLTILKNEKYKGDALLQKFFIPDHLSKKKKRNLGQVDSFYVEGNHPPIIPAVMWDQVQQEMKRRAQVKGNVEDDIEKYLNRYHLTGKLHCFKCGAVMKRRTWNSNLDCRKIVWQCSNYIKNGKSTCSGISIEDELVSKFEIQEEVIIKEGFQDGKKHYSYTRKSEQHKPGKKRGTPEKKDGGLLSGIDRPTRAAIEL